MLTTSKVPQCFIVVSGAEVQKGPLSPNVSVEAHSVVYGMSVRSHTTENECFSIQKLPFYFHSY